MSLELSICVLFILLAQSVKAVQFLNITFSSPLFEAAVATAMFGTVIISLTSM